DCGETVSCLLMLYRSRPLNAASCKNVIRSYLRIQDFSERLMISWAFIFEAPETDPGADRLIIERGGVRSIVVSVPEQSDVVQVAVELVRDGVQFIELSGGFEPIWAGKVVNRRGILTPFG